MEFKFSLDELMQLGEISGRIAGIADGLPLPDADITTSTNNLYEVSSRLYEMVKGKINELPDSKTIPDDISRP